MRPTDKALILRKAIRLRSKEPMRLFINRLREPERILNIIEKQECNSTTRMEARRQFIVSVCAAFESYWRMFVRANMDAHSIPKTAVEHLKRISFTLSDIHSIVGRKLTIGELVSCSFSFQGPDAVNVALSEILQINVFGEFSKAKFLIREVPNNRTSKRKKLAQTELTGAQILRSTCADLKLCYEIRHDTVHSTGALYKVSERFALTIDNTAWQFNVFLGMYLEGRISELWRGK